MVNLRLRSLREAETYFIGTRVNLKSKPEYLATYRGFLWEVVSREVGPSPNQRYEDEIP